MTPRQRALVASTARLVRDVLALVTPSQADANARTVEAFGVFLDNMASTGAGDDPRFPVEPVGPHVVEIFVVLASVSGIDFEDSRVAESVFQVAQGALAAPAAVAAEGAK